MIDVAYPWTDVPPTIPGYYWHRLKNDNPKLYFIGYPCKNGTHNITKLNKKQKLAICLSSDKLTSTCVEPVKFLGLWQSAFANTTIE